MQKSMDTLFSGQRKSELMGCVGTTEGAGGFQGPTPQGFSVNLTQPSPLVGFSQDLVVSETSLFFCTLFISLLPYSMCLLTVSILW